MDRAVRAMRHSSSESELCQSCCDAITIDAAYPLAWIGFARNDEQHNVEIVAKSGQDIAYLSEVKITWADEPKGRGLAGSAIRSGKTQVVGNIDASPILDPWRQPISRAGFHSAVGIPILDRSECFGVLMVYSGRMNAFDEDSVSVLENLAEVIGFGMSLYRTTEAMLSERHKAMALSEEKLRTLRLLTVLTDGSNDAIFAKDTEGRYLLCNREMLRSSGKSLADVIGKTDEDIFPPDDAARISERDRSAMQWTAPATFEEKMTTIDGERDLLSTRGPIKEPTGNVLGVFGIARDITERKYVEERWKFALEGAGDGVWDWNIQTGRATFSKRYKEMLGHAEDDISTAASEWGRIHPDDLSGTMATIRGHLDGKTPSAKTEFRMSCKDGSWKWMLGRGMVVGRDGQGKPRRLVGTITDITERKQAEIALTESLREMERKELSKTRFLAAAGHDMRQPIAAANLFVEALKFTTLNGRQSELIERLGQSMSVFSNMLDRLLDISKFDAGLIKPQITSSNLDELLVWLDQNFAQTALQKQLRFRLFYPTRRSLSVRTDIGLVQSVLMNLVSNAIKFTERGSILIGARQRGDKVLVQVWDTGIGIAEADLAHVFDEFYQVANQQRSRDAGLGLGLSICQRAMSVLGGAVTCRSRQGRGSVFQFSLPLDGGQTTGGLQPNGNAPNEIIEMTPLSGKHVVLVEDDALVADAMIGVLEGMGSEVSCYHSAEDALRQADIEHADCYIVDYMLGGTYNGIQCLNLLRQKRGGPINAVLMTGDTSSDFIRTAATLDWPVLHKPVNVSMLVSSLCVQGGDARRSDESDQGG